MTEQEIRSQANSFKLFLRYTLREQELWNILNFIARHNQIYIFSGVIRDFFTGMISSVRDVDIVVQETKFLDLLFSRLSNVTVRRNSFGGYKLKYKDLTFDVWGIKDTWNIKCNHLNPSPYILVNTVFFNFSAIVFDFQKEKFIYRKEFIQFLETQEMDIINPINPNETLCILNTLYYRDKYHFTISKKLAKWVKQHYKSNMPFHNVQLSHFGRSLYSINQINEFIQSI